MERKQGSFLWAGASAHYCVDDKRGLLRSHAPIFLPTPRSGCLQVAFSFDNLYVKQQFEAISPNIRVINHPASSAATDFRWSHHDKLVIVDREKVSACFFFFFFSKGRCRWVLQKFIQACCWPYPNAPSNPALHH